MGPHPRANGHEPYLNGSVPVGGSFSAADASISSAFDGSITPQPPPGTSILSTGFEWPQGWSFDANGQLLYSVEPVAGTQGPDERGARAPGNGSMATSPPVTVGYSAFTNNFEPSDARTGHMSSQLSPDLDPMHWMSDMHALQGQLSLVPPTPAPAPPATVIPTSVPSATQPPAAYQDQQHRRMDSNLAATAATGQPQSHTAGSKILPSPATRYHPYLHQSSPRLSMSMTSPSASTGSAGSIGLQSSQPTPASVAAGASLGSIARPPVSGGATSANTPILTTSAGTSPGSFTPAVASPISGPLSMAIFAQGSAPVKMVHDVMYPDTVALPAVQFTRAGSSARALVTLSSWEQRSIDRATHLPKVQLDDQVWSRMRRNASAAGTPRLRRSRSFSGLSASARLSTESDKAPAKLDKVMDALEQVDWTVGEFMEALLDVEGQAMTRRSRLHIEKLARFVGGNERIGYTSAPSVESSIDALQRLARTRHVSDESLETTVNDVYRSSPGIGSVIRNILTRDGSTYAESPHDIEMLDATLSQSTALDDVAQSRTNQAETTLSGQTRFTGMLVIPPQQADILGAWLMAPGRPILAQEKDSIKPDHMRIYSSLPPLELHARGAELCRVVLTRDRALKAQFGHLSNELENFVVGPVIPPSRRCGFHDYDDYSLWHHACLTYLQLCTRYPGFQGSKAASIVIEPDLSTLSSSSLELKLVEKQLQTHWETFRQHLLSEGGLLRSAVRMFAESGGKGVKDVRPVDLMLICEDTNAVLKALKRSIEAPSERILPYDPTVSEARNAWRQSAFWSDNSHFVGWSAATTHFLEISALYPRFSENVRELPGLEKLLKKE
ncbi:hypothetical protein OIV83_000655 [Microbotryomycetes sp. JL201]|nr:hypothetical protein OIV83_000655 [Microbotryomycetes sp. JL201]